MNLKGMDPSMMKQAEAMWKMLDDMAESSPEEYKKFIEANIKRGMAEAKEEKDKMTPEEKEKMRKKLQMELQKSGGGLGGPVSLPNKEVLTSFPVENDEKNSFKLKTPADSKEKPNGEPKKGLIQEIFDENEIRIIKESYIGKNGTVEIEIKSVSCVKDVVLDISEEAIKVKSIPTNFTKFQNFQRKIVPSSVKATFQKKKQLLILKFETI